MKKKKINFSFILIILLGLILSCSVFLMLNLDKEEVLIANRNIEPMEVLSEDMLSTKFVDKNYMIEGYVPYEEMRNIIGKTVKYGIPNGNFVVTGQFYNDTEFEELRMDESQVLLFNLPLTAQDAVGGNLKEGDRINITFGYKSSAKPEEGLDTSKKILTILQYIEIDSLTIVDDELAGIVLKLTQEQYNKLTYAMEYASTIYITKLAENYVQIENIEENEETFLEGGKASNGTGIVVNVPDRESDDDGRIENEDNTGGTDE